MAVSNAVNLLVESGGEERSGVGCTKARFILLTKASATRVAACRAVQQEEMRVGVHKPSYIHGGKEEESEKISKEEGVDAIRISSRKPII